MKPLFVGEAPSPSTDGRPGAAPLVGETGRRLAAWANLSPSEFRRRAECVNLFDRLPDRWRPREARDLALAIWIDRVLVADRPRVVLLGEKVADAFGFQLRAFIWDRGVAMMPHPSGLNHYWNERANVRRAERFLCHLLGSKPSPRQPRLRMGGTR